MTQDNRGANTVRMFPDYADTVLWLDGPVDYEDSGLSLELIRKLQEWEQTYYASLDSDFEWISSRAAHAFTVAGVEMAGRVADELGDEFVIELNSYGDDARSYAVQSAGPAANEEALTAFTRIVAEIAAEEERVAHYGDPLRWAAIAPRSGDVFAWDEKLRRTEDGEQSEGAPGRT